MENYSRIRLPGSGYELMKFPPERAKIIKDIADTEIKDGKWEFAKAIPIDLNDDYFWAYWLTKTQNAIKRPLEGNAGLEEFFKKRKDTEYVLNGGCKGNAVTLSAVGDLMCTEGIDASKDTLYENVEDEIFGADIRFANLESTFAPGDIKGISFNSGEGPKINLTLDQYKSLVDYKGKKYDIVQLANNHIVDEGEAGVAATLRQLDKDGIVQTGVNLSPADSDKATITHFGGLKIGWIAHTFFVNFRPLPENKPWIVNITPFYVEKNPDLSQIMRQIEYCKAQKCEIIIASMHWGLEFEAYPHPQQREWAQRLADAGADIILGHHPHVMQFSEILHPADRPDKDVPVIYSLGNLTPIFSGPETAMSLISSFKIQRGEKPKVTGLSLTPVAMVDSDIRGRLLVKLSELSNFADGAADPQMKEYIKKASNYADLILGTGWRQ